jgi:hypothetical protein
MYRPYWSDVTEGSYNRFMESSFQMYNGVAALARIRTTTSMKVAAYEEDKVPWNAARDRLFTNERDPDLPQNYTLLVSSILNDTVTFGVRR